jgi:hypothetical protein
MRLTNGIPLGSPLLLIVAIINYVETLKAQVEWGGPVEGTGVGCWRCGGSVFIGTTYWVGFGEVAVGPQACIMLAGSQRMYVWVDGNVLGVRRVNAHTVSLTIIHISLLLLLCFFLAFCATL